mmetsp:Transcript_15060/g.23579  ORF Transcript_15060/g.23579 Transcript_15060/m.23579 type:complete len:207 (-) Transcript_15060:381-1001(-)
MGNVNDPQAINKLNQAAQSTPIPLQSHSLRIGVSSGYNNQAVTIISKNVQIIQSLVGYLQTINGGLTNTSFVNQGVAYVFRGYASLEQDVCATVIVDYILGNSSFTWLCEGKAAGKGWSQIRLSFVSGQANMLNDNSKQQVVKQVVVMQPANSMNENSVSKDKELPLPAGWSKAYTNDGKLYYKNDVTKSTQWEHPSLSKGKETWQ